MRTKLVIAAGILLGLLPFGPARAQPADDKQEFQRMVAALRVSDTERLSSITSCTEQGVGADPNPSGIAKFLGVPVGRAWEAWCTRVTKDIADGKLTPTDINGLNGGQVTDNAREVLTTVPKGK